MISGIPDIEEMQGLNKLSQVFSIVCICLGNGVKHTIGLRDYCLYNNLISLKDKRSR